MRWLAVTACAVLFVVACSSSSTPAPGTPDAGAAVGELGGRCNVDRTCNSHQLFCDGDGYCEFCLCDAPPPPPDAGNDAGVDSGAADADAGD